MTSIQQLKDDIRFANEGLEQMQQPGAGYFEDEANRRPEELTKYRRDVDGQCKQIDRMERRLSRLEKEQR